MGDLFLREHLSAGWRSKFLGLTKKEQRQKDSRDGVLLILKTQRHHQSKTPGQILQDLEKKFSYPLIFYSSPADITVLKK